jgi:hypothetical protein
MEKKLNSESKKVLLAEINNLFKICSAGKSSKDVKHFHELLKSKHIKKSDLFELQKSLLKKKERNLINYNKIKRNLEIAESQNVDLGITIPINLTKLYDSDYTRKYIITDLVTQIEFFDLLFKEFIFEEINRRKLLSLLKQSEQKRDSLCKNFQSQIDNIQEMKQALQSKVYHYEKKIKTALDSDEEREGQNLSETVSENQIPVNQQLTESLHITLNEIEQNKFVNDKITFAIKNEYLGMDDSDEDEDYIKNLNQKVDEEIDGYIKATEEYEKMMEERFGLLENDAIGFERRFANLEGFIDDENIPHKKKSLININPDCLTEEKNRSTSDFSNSQNQTEKNESSLQN